MKLSHGAVCLAIFIIALPVRADIFLGAIGTEPGTPIAGEEDIAIFNFTGATDGCSTLNGTPICTPVSFDGAVLTINGTTQLALGDVGPGVTETYMLPGGVFVDGSITSLSFSADLSSTTLMDDEGDTYHVDSSIFLSGLPLDGTLANINGSLVTIPEPNMLPLLLPFLVVFGVVLIRAQSRV